MTQNQNKKLEMWLYKAPFLYKNMKNHMSECRNHKDKADQNKTVYLFMTLHVLGGHLFWYIDTI